MAKQQLQAVWRPKKGGRSTVLSFMPTEQASLGAHLRACASSRNVRSTLLQNAEARTLLLWIGELVEVSSCSYDGPLSGSTSSVLPRCWPAFGSVRLRGRELVTSNVSIDHVNELEYL
jgi:hypothetical protein